MYAMVLDVAISGSLESPNRTRNLGMDDTFSLSLTYYAVGFFDLLGQQEHLRKLTRLPEKNDPAALATTREDLRHTYGAVLAMRKCFDDAFANYIRKPFANDALTPEQRIVYSQMTNNPIQAHGFSDSMLVFLALTNTDTAKLHVRGVLGIISSAAFTFLGCLGIGHPIRGGIDIGIGFQPSEREIYGPALSRAYALESNIAKYPRIVVGDEMIRYLAATNNQAPVDTFAHESKTIAAQCIQCLAYDDDGIPFVDFLGPYFRDLFGGLADATFIDIAYNKVLEFADRAKKEKNSKLAFRYTLLRNYFEDRLQLWADLPRHEKATKNGAH